MKKTNSGTSTVSWPLQHPLSMWMQPSSFLSLQEIQSMPNFKHTNECPGYNKLDELGQIERTEKMDCNKTSHKIADSLLQAPV